jgi:hypothetical protein
MKNKAMVYILGIMVAIIWGIIIYRILAAVNKDDDIVTPTVSGSIKKEPLDDRALVKDTGTLKLNYRDPFGQAKPEKDTVQLPVRQLIRSTGTSTFRLSVPKPVINWGFIKYSGYIRNPRSKKLIALVNINGKSLMLSEGESAEQVKLLKNLKDSIKVAYNNHTKFIAVNTGP